MKMIVVIEGMMRSLAFREVGEINNGGYLVPRSAYRKMQNLLWSWRLAQVAKIEDFYKRPRVMQGLWEATGYHTPQFLESYRQTQRTIGDAVDDLYDVMESLRKDKHYKQADRIRTIMSRLANALPYNGSGYDENGKPMSIREIAKTFK